MHLLLHRECILNGPQERLGNSKAFTIILSLHHLGWKWMKQHETTINWCKRLFILRIVSGWLSEASWDKLDDSWKDQNGATKYRVSTTCLPGNSSASGVHFTGWHQQNMCKLVERLHYFTFLDSQASWVKTAIRFAQPSWLVRGTTSADDFPHSSKLDGWSTEPKQNLQNRRSGSYLITLMCRQPEAWGSTRGWWKDVRNSRAWFQRQHL